MSLLTLLIARFSANRRPAPSPVSSVQARVPLNDQMSRLEGVISASIERSALSGRYHTAAEDQLDAATYALRELMKDLSAVMPIPSLHTGAALYQLPVAAATDRRARVSAAA